VPGYAIANKHDAEVIIQRHLVAPGFRIIGISQRLCRLDLLETPGEVVHDENGEIFQYSDGDDVTVVCFNFSFPQGLALCKDMEKRGIHPSLFSVNAMLPVDWTRIINNVRRTKRLVLLDDSKSVNGSYHHLGIAVQQELRPQRLLILTREKDDRNICPNADQFAINHEQVLTQLGLVSREPARSQAPTGEVLQKA
jgi:deoxyxylulose-5-phosphate synthase